MSCTPYTLNKVKYPLKYVREIAEPYFKFFNWKTKSKVLHIGSRSGHFLSEVLPLFPKSYKEILCVESLENRVNCFNSEEQDPRIGDLRMDIQSKNLPANLNGRFDFVCASVSLMYLSNIRQTLTNVSQLLNKNGELFFLWPKRGYVHDFYKALSRIEKWNPYMDEFKHWDNYFDNENPVQTMNRELKNIGMEVLKSDLIELSIIDPDKMNFFGMFDCLDYMSVRIPKNDLHQYKEDYHKLVQTRLIRETSNDNKIKWKLPVDSVIVAARKR